MERLQERLAQEKLVDLIGQQQDIVVLEHNQTVADALKVRDVDRWAVGTDHSCPGSVTSNSSRSPCIKNTANLQSSR